jgi:fluoride ion exporter CrcB/FEX
MSANTTLKPREFVMALSSCVVGGFVGCFARALFTGWEHLPAPTSSVYWAHEIPWVWIAINFVGVLAATRLLRGPLRRRDPNDRLRVLIITGFFGGFTSYSGLFIDLAAIWHVSPSGCVFIALGAILSGVLAAWLGLLRPSR